MEELLFQMPLVKLFMDYFVHFKSVTLVKVYIHSKVTYASAQSAVAQQNRILEDTQVFRVSTPDHISV